MRLNALRECSSEKGMAGEGKETTGSPLRTQTQYIRTLGEEPAGPTLPQVPGFDRCIKAAICNKSATRAMRLWKITQGLRSEGNSSSARSRGIGLSIPG
jgi:hypothetical protein